VIAARAVALWRLVNRGRHRGFVINVVGVVGCSFGLEFGAQALTYQAQRRLE
jgi:hypothetical protein